jgi:hypothetical protein
MPLWGIKCRNWSEYLVLIGIFPIGKNNEMMGGMNLLFALLRRCLGSS